jgi:NAD(P)-dependent dehydrogenase (short-subunit alcohol dehydrogenase family)
MRTGYCSAKFALLGYYEALRAEVDAAYGVKVLTVLPGSVRTAVDANALQGDGSQRGVSDANIDGGMDPDDVARQIVAAILVIAEGGEMGAYQMRMSDPERLYDGVAREGVRMAAQRAAAGEGQALILDPSRNR